jgi:hypothetical protein
VIGVSNFARTPAELQLLYNAVLTHARDGALRLDFETFALDDVEEAWRRQSTGAKAVVTF